MIIYLIKSTVILAIVLLVHKLLFEKEKMHRFNRFYLLSGLILAYAAPLITIGSIEVPLEITTLTADTFTPMVIDIEQTVSAGSASLYSILIDCSLFVSFLLLLKFLWNISQFFKTTQRSEKITYNDFSLILVQKTTMPHTFLNNVYITKSEFEQQNIEDEILMHEMTHAREWHSVDIIMIEILKALFWFNPLLPIYKRAIQLNHEFIADQSVINAYGSAPRYQALLIDKASHKKETYLASNLNFSLTKKRLKMMTKSTASWKAYLFAGSVIPLFVCILMMFGHHAVAQSSGSNISMAEKAKYFDNAAFLIKDKKQKRVYQSFDELPDDIKASIPLPPPVPKKKNDLPTYRVIQYDINSHEVKLLSEMNSPVPPFPPAPPEAPSAPSHVIPPPPPPPPSPMDMVIEVAKAGGTFILNGEEVSSDTIIEAMKSNKHFTIDIHEVGSKNRLEITTHKK